MPSSHNTRTTNEEAAPHLEEQGNTEMCHLSSNKLTLSSLKLLLYDATAAVICGDTEAEGNQNS